MTLDALVFAASLLTGTLPYSSAASKNASYSQSSTLSLQEYQNLTGAQKIRRFIDAAFKRQGDKIRTPYSFDVPVGHEMVAVKVSAEFYNGWDLEPNKCAKITFAVNSDLERCSIEYIRPFVAYPDKSVYPKEPDQYTVVYLPAENDVMWDKLSGNNEGVGAVLEEETMTIISKMFSGIGRFGVEMLDQLIDVAKYAKDGPLDEQYKRDLNKIFGEERVSRERIVPKELRVVSPVSVPAIQNEKIRIMYIPWTSVADTAKPVAFRFYFRLNLDDGTESKLQYTDIIMPDVQ